MRPGLSIQDKPRWTSRRHSVGRCSHGSHYPVQREPQLDVSPTAKAVDRMRGLRALPKASPELPDACHDARTGPPKRQPAREE